MGATIPAAVACFGDVLARVEYTLEKVKDVIRRILVNCKRWLPWLGGVGGQLARLIGAIGRLLEHVVREVGRFLTRPGDPVTLWTTGVRWTTDVGAPVSNRAGTFTTDFQHSDDRWQGPAARSYERALPPQRAALEKTEAVSAKIGDSLHEVAIAIGMFWVAVAAATAALLADLIVSAAATATVVGAAPGAANAGASLGRYVAAFSALTLGLAAFLNVALRAQSGLEQQVSDNATFPGPPAGHWPASTTAAFADGSMSDGDGADWRLIY
jgi:hypothetical protein